MSKSPFFVIAHNIRSLENVGSVFRTSDAFGVTKLFLTGYTGKPPEQKISKTALGAELVVPWEKHVSAVRLITRLKKEHPGLTVVGLENNILTKRLVSLSDFNASGSIALVLGTETTGIPRNVQKVCDVFVEIPMRGEKESLNVAVAFGIAAFVIALRR